MCKLNLFYRSQLRDLIKWHGMFRNWFWWFCEERIGETSAYPIKTKECHNKSNSLDGLFHLKESDKKCLNKNMFSLHSSDIYQLIVIYHIINWFLSQFHYDLTLDASFISSLPISIVNGMPKLGTRKKKMEAYPFSLLYAQYICIVIPWFWIIHDIYVFYACTFDLPFEYVIISPIERFILLYAFVLWLLLLFFKVWMNKRTYLQSIERCRTDKFAC